MKVYRICFLKELFYVGERFYVGLGLDNILDATNNICYFDIIQGKTYYF